MSGAGRTIAAEHPLVPPLALSGRSFAHRLIHNISDIISRPHLLSPELDLLPALPGLLLNTFVGQMELRRVFPCKRWQHILFKLTSFSRSSCAIICSIRALSSMTGIVDLSSSLVDKRGHVAFQTDLQGVRGWGGRGLQAGAPRSAHTQEFAIPNSV